MYVKTKKREYIKLNKSKYTAEEDFYNTLRKLFPDKHIRRRKLRGTSKYNNGLKWVMGNIWLKGVIKDSKGSRELISIKIIGEDHYENFLRRRVNVVDEKIDLTEIHLKMRVIQKWLDEDEIKYKKEKKLLKTVQRLRKQAKITPQDSKLYIDSENINSDKFELTLHFLTEWQLKHIVKFYQGIITGENDVYLVPVSERKFGKTSEKDK